MDAHQEDWRTNSVVIREICRNLDVNSILSLRLVCRDWYNASKGVIAKNAAVNLTVSTDISKKTSWKVDTEDDAYDLFLKYVEFIYQNSREFRCENLKMGYCPDLKSHQIWDKIGPTIKNLVVFPLHKKTTCELCIDSTAFTRGLTQNFPNLVSLTIKENPWRIHKSTEEDEQDSDQNLVTTPIPTVEKLECLNQLSLDTDCFDLPQDFIIEHVVQLKCLKFYAYTETATSNDTLYTCLKSIADSVDEKRFETLYLSCRHHPQRSDVLDDWFTVFSAKNMVFTYTAPSTEIQDIMEEVPRCPNVWLSFRVIDAQNLEQIEELIKQYLNRMAWTRTCLRLDFLACHPQVVQQKISFSKHFFPNSSVELLSIGAKAFMDNDKLLSEKLFELLPSASFMCVSMRGVVKAEIFGPARLLFPNLKNLFEFTVNRDYSKVVKHLMHTPQFRRIVGIPDNWCPPGCKDGNIYLTFFSLDFKRINEARLKLPTFVYPEKRLEDTYQIFQGYRDTRFPDKSQGKVVLKWADPLCLELASGKRICEGPLYKILKTET